MINLRRQPLLLLLMLLLCGCGGTGPRRVPVEGQVTQAGQPINGIISFLPAGDNGGPAANTDVVDGRYRFTPADGPAAGPHRVVVTLFSQSKQGLLSDPKAAAQAQRSIDPQGSWTFEVEVTEGEDGKKNFVLK